MADIVKSTNVLSIVQSFTDGDDRTFTIDNPKASVTAAEINDLSDYMRANNIVLGDKAGADFSLIKSAKIISGTTTYFDLTD